MKNILVLGAGLSSATLIRYLKAHASKEQWNIYIADASLDQASLRAGKHKNCKAVALDIQNKKQRTQYIQQSDLVISLLPPALHVLAAKDCIQFGKHMITASYISPAMAELDAAAKKAGVMVLNEMGLDPGIDHLSAMKMIHEIRGAGGRIDAFRSYCGGLIAPEYDTNPWHYKFTWNPRNVVTAGQATATYLEAGKVRLVPASRLFAQTEPIEKEFEAYLNRDSLHYIKPYGLEEAHTVLRGTLRMRGFSKAWDVLVKLGMTDDTAHMDTTRMTLKDFTAAFLPKGCDSLKNYVATLPGYEKDRNAYNKIKWLGLESNELIRSGMHSPASVLLDLLQQKWKLLPGDLDRIVMIHYIDYTDARGRKKSARAFLEVTGEDEVYTAMSKTVGLPLAIAAKLILKGKIQGCGVIMPLTPDIYIPVLHELEKQGVAFRHS